MAHYAILDENNVVLQVTVGKDENEIVEGISNWEEYYGGKRTSFNTFRGEHIGGGIPFRGNYAGIGYTYDPVLDAFIPPKPYDSWILNTTVYDWESPTPMPETGNWRWVEETQSWVEIN
jgi:hypothetical protein